MKIARNISRALMGQRLRFIRERAGMSRAEMVKETGIGRSTLERMEAGTSPVEVCDFLNIYDAAGANPLHDFCILANPELVAKVPEMLRASGLSDQDREYDKAWNQAYDAMTDLAKSCNLKELQILAYLLSGEYGGDRYAFLNKMLADALCPAGSRSATCGLVASNYEDAVSMGLLPEHHLPVDLEAVKNARERGTAAHRAGNRTYN